MIYGRIDFAKDFDEISFIRVDIVREIRIAYLSPMSSPPVISRDINAY